MKKKIQYQVYDQSVEREINYIPVRYILAIMTTLPGNYAKVLRSYGIQATPFSRMRGNADSEFNNRSHRKIMVIDGKIGYTGGVNIADEYINAIVKHGHWKDVGLRMEGEAVMELTKLFQIDFGLNFRNVPASGVDCFPKQDEIHEPGFIHAKSYLVDGDYAMIGTINLDYLSLVHHFENGVWMYRCDCIRSIKADIEDTLAKSIRITEENLDASLMKRILRSVVRILAPLL